MFIELTVMHGKDSTRVCSFNINHIVKIEDAGTHAIIQTSTFKIDIDVVQTYDEIMKTIGST